MKGRIVAIDFGKKRVGVAVSDPLRMFAQPFGTFTPDTIVDALRTLHQADGIEHFIVGWPLTLSGEEAEATQFVQRFIDRLKKAFPAVPITKWDERFTSEVAKEAIRAGGARKKARQEKARVDAAAAAVMLQEYLRAASY